MLDERWIRSLHVEALRRADLHAEHESHALFQASTIGALLDGAYDGDLSFAELAEHGDLGLGTLNGLDGEMIALDGDFFRADVDGAIHPVPAEAKTPFAVVAEFAPSIDTEIEGGSLPRRAAAPARRADSRRRALLRDSARRPLRPGPRSLGPAAAPSLPAAGRGRRRAARVRAGRRRRDHARLPLPRLRGGDRGRRLPPPLHLRGSLARRPRARLPARPACASGSTPPSTSTSSCRRASSSPIPISPPRPTRRSSGSNTRTVSSAGRPPRTRSPRRGGSRAGR